MPIRYYIHPELNLVIYICRGEIRGVDLFQAADIAYRDPLRKPGLVAIYDMLYAVENIDLDEIRVGTQRLERATDPGLGVGLRVLITRSQGIHLCVESMKLLPANAQIQIDACDTLEDAIAHLGLTDRQEEIIRFWEECNSLYEKSKAS